MVGTAHRIALKLSHAKIAQLLPVVGMFLILKKKLKKKRGDIARLFITVGLAIGAGGNYAFARETTNYGMMILRKRWLMQKYLYIIFKKKKN
jgi:hypothetical protein